MQHLNTYDEQIALEEECRALSIDKFHRIHEDAAKRGFFAETTAGSHILKSLISPMVEKIEEYMETHNPRFIAWRMLKEFDDHEAVAMLFLKSVLGLVLVRKQKRTSAETNQDVYYGIKANMFWAKVGDVLHDELVLRHFAKNEGNIMRKLIKQADQRHLTRQRRREHYRKAFRDMQMDWQMEGWDKSNRVQLSTTLFHLFQEMTNAFNIRTVFTGNQRSERLINFTAEWEEKMLEILKSGESLHLSYYPMVHPPRPWQNDNLISSPYLSDSYKPTSLVKRSPIHYIRDLELTDLSIPLRAINAIQSTPWRINKEMLQAVTEAYEEGYGVEGLPPSNPLPLPPLPPNLEEGSAEWKQNKADCAMVHRMNRKAVGRRIQLFNALAVAKRFVGYDRIYFPHDMDSRGRMYPIPTHLNPQSTANIRALLEFADGRPIDNEEQVGYLAIAGANAFGHDKLALQDRIDWVFDNEDMIISIATDWRQDRRWVRTDSPFEFLRFCMEWKGLADHGPGFISHMPVNLDATCSGLQHFSAILRDHVGGFNVNLTDHPERQDIYKAVADLATENITRDLADPNKAAIAQIALDIGISRSLTKRSVMIVPYSGTFKACMNYIEQYYLELFEQGEITFNKISEEEISRNLTPYVAKHVWAAISNTVIAARQGMDWITKVSRLITKGSRKDEPIVWSTPSGFTVRQSYMQSNTKDVWTYMHGKMRVRLLEPTNKVDSRTTASAISPNFIHSMDAAHLQLTVNKAVLERGEGNMSFAMIHDSFGTHAADIPYLINECIKPCFYQMYTQEDVLEKFLEQLLPMIDDPSEIPPMPQKGQLDLDCIFDSQFFFS